ncbi:uncharacterized protein LOC131945980 [Physella acuta]|uniref:uncharacterized protein LOC131945980 n=1 Tax=Physella acuta TaxID=109671 RepID=UPI0027DC6944|nr:uncharacterized protein LOC131945980 [Physella acuta]
MIIIQQDHFKMSFKVPNNFTEDDSELSFNKHEEEFYLIRVPKGFDVKKLQNREFDVNQIVEIEVGNEDKISQLTPVYELTAFNHQDGIFLPGLDVVPIVKTKHNKTTLGPPLSGFVCVTKSQRQNPSDLQQHQGIPPPGPVAMPEGLRPRYTPFGAGTGAVQKHSHRSKKKKRKHSAISSNDNEHHNKRRKVDSFHEITTPETNVTTPRKKHHKKTFSDSDNFISFSNGSHVPGETDECETPVIKRKHKKKS